MQCAIVQTGYCSLFAFMCSKITSHVIHCFPWLMPWKRLKYFFFPAAGKGIICMEERRLPIWQRGGEGPDRCALPSTHLLPFCRGCVDLLNDVLTWRVASIWSGAWLAGCHAYRNHICISAWPASTGRNSKGAGTKMKGHENPILVWSGLCVLSLLQGKLHPIWPILLLSYASVGILQHPKIFCREWSLQFYDEMMRMRKRL